MGDRAVARADFDVILGQVRHSYRQAGRVFPEEGTTEYQRLKDEIVRFLVLRAMFEEKAEELALVVTDARVDERLTEIKRQVFGGDEERYREHLRREGLTDADVRGNVRAELVAEAVLGRVIPPVTVTASEIAAYYRAHRRDFRQPAQRTVRHIVVRTRALAARIHSQLRAGASFAALARKHSLDSGTKRRGGRLTIGKGQTIQPFDRIAFSLRTRALSRPFQTRVGWHVVQALTDVRPARQLPLARVRETIRARIAATRLRAAVTAFLAALDREFAPKTAYAPGFGPR